MAVLGIVGLIGTALSVVVLIICVIAKQRVVLPLILLVLFTSTLILSVGFSADLHLMLFEESDPDTSQIQSDETESDTSDTDNGESEPSETVSYPEPADILPQPDESATAPSITSSARDLLYALIEAGLPLLSVFEYDETTCPNGLLGRPNQYIERIDWRDSRYSEEGDSASIEVFANNRDMQLRKEHIESVWEAMPILRQHLYYNDTMLLRLPLSYSSATADEYEAIFNSLR